MKQLEYIIKSALRVLAEQAPEAPKKETDNASTDAVDSPFTPAEEKFLGKFDAYGTTHLGIIYSPSDIGVREFISRSGADLNLTPGTLISLLRKNAIKIVPYTGYGRNTDYTVELQLSLDDVKGLGAEDKAAAEKGSSASGAADMGGGEMPPPPPTGPAPEVAWVIPYGDLITESTKIAKRLISEKAKSNKKKSDSATVHVDKSRILKRLPKTYISQLERIIDMMSKRAHTAFEKQRIVADILDNLAVNLKLTDKQIRKSYEFYKNQNKLKSVVDDLNENFILEAKPPVKSSEWLALKPEMNNAKQFWQKVNTATNSWNFDENLLVSTCTKRIKNRKSAIIIDAIGLILYAGSQTNNSVAFAFLDDNFQNWEDAVSSRGIWTLKGLFEDSDIMDFGFEWDGRSSNTAIDSLRNKGVARVSAERTKANRYFYYPTYSKNDVGKMKQILLSPYMK